ncbi:hypothetical protein BU17DRAFT_65250 [Hysterangium stoloniferum]|nr:hypothetical protein BU17DRAFT_65250 [Hysterangium stoloniferum]
MCIMSPYTNIMVPQRKAVLGAISYEGQQGEDGKNFFLPASLHELPRMRKFLMERCDVAAEDIVILYDDPDMEHIRPTCENIRCRKQNDTVWLLDDGHGSDFDWTYDKNKPFKPRLRDKNHILDDWIVAVRKGLLRFLTMVLWNMSVPSVETSHVPWSRELPLLKIDSRYYVKLEQLRALVARARAWESAFSSGLPDKELAAGQVANENVIESDGLDEYGDHQPVEQGFEAASMWTRTIVNNVYEVRIRQNILDDVVVWRVDLLSVVSVQCHRPSEVPHLWRAIEYVHWDATPFGAQIPHTAIVLLSEIDDCNERPHHPPTNIRTDFAAALSHTVCRYTMTSAQRISAWRCTMERASKKQCASVLRKRDVDNTATAFAGSYSKAGIKASLLSWMFTAHRGCQDFPEPYPVLYAVHWSYGKNTVLSLGFGTKITSLTIWVIVLTLRRFETTQELKETVVLPFPIGAQFVVFRYHAGSAGHSVSSLHERSIMTTGSQVVTGKTCNRNPGSSGRPDDQLLTKASAWSRSRVYLKYTRNLPRALQGCSRT